jgi:hypothetical protein
MVKRTLLFIRIPAHRSASSRDSKVSVKSPNDEYCVIVYMIFPFGLPRPFPVGAQSTNRG